MSHMDLLSINVCYELMTKDRSIKFILFHPKTNISKYIDLKQVTNIIQTANKTDDTESGAKFICVVDLPAL